MAKLEITGTVHHVGNTTPITSKSGNTIYKRELILDTTRYDQFTGQRSEYENFPKFEFRGDKCAKLDNVNMGDVIKVFFDINGRFYTNKDNQQSHINNVEGYDVEIVRSVAASPNTMQPQVQQPVQQAAPMPQQAYAPQYPQAPQGFAPQAPYGGNPMQGGGNAPF